MASGDQAASRGGSCPIEPIASNRAAVAQYTMPMPTASARPPMAPRVPTRNAKGAPSSTIIAAISGNANFFCHCTARRAVSNPALRRALDVLPELPPVHLVILADFAPEIVGRFGELGQRVGFERKVAGYFSGRIEIADPSAGKHPGVFARLPGGASGEDPAGDLECRRIQLEYVQAAEKLPIGIKELVVIDFVVLAKNPLARPGWK